MISVKSVITCICLCIASAAQAAELPLEATYSEALSVPVNLEVAQRHEAFDPLFAVTPAALSHAKTNNAPAMTPGCATATRLKGASLIIGARSRCMGGNLSSAEKAIILFDKTAHQRSAAASLALQEDPRNVTHRPLTASAGLAMAFGSSTRIGVEYSFAENGDISPFHFNNASGAMNDNVGHSATLRVDLHL